MPRHAWLYVPGTLHHVIARGIEGSNIFQDEEDRQVFVELKMNLEWDERKRHLNLDKQGLDFFDAHAVFQGPHLAVPSIYDGVEERFLAIGLFKGRWVTVVYTIRNEATRIISFRRARYEERQKYQEL